MKKKSFLLLISLVLVITLSACGGSKETGTTAEKTRSLRLAHTQSSNHPVHKSMERFAELTKEKTDGTVEIEIIPDGVLGDEREYVESLQKGVLDMAKVSVNSLENFDEVWSIFALPYVFDDMEHGQKFMDSPEMEELYQSAVDTMDILGLTWYDAGGRNYYTKDKPIEKPEDLEGLTMRVQSSKIQIKTAEYLGGSATPVDFGELYTAIQQGVVDGADNGIVAFTENNLGEVAKHFSFTQHVYSPDILLIKDSLFKDLTPEQQDAVKEAAKESTKFHSETWEEERQEAIKKCEDIGVTIHYPDLEPFAEKLKPLRDEYAENERIAKYMDLINEMK